MTSGNGDDRPGASRATPSSILLSTRWPAVTVLSASVRISGPITTVVHERRADVRVRRCRIELSSLSCHRSTKPRGAAADYLY
jgi:hypothetical protein